ncbi:MAG TPA: sigma-70 family RNA polymerase sigma factor, partial [Chloroflexia bacterium]|nr:sigma-70 family RNA polymerase sigma factor [Chloroflexia bacterium]
CEVRPLHEQLQLKAASKAELPEVEAESEQALAGRGDMGSFVLLYREHLKAVYGYLYSRLVNRQEAEDLTSLTFERAWQSLPNYQPTGSFKSWLFTIAHRTLADHLRQKKPHPVSLGILADVLLDPAIGPEEAALVSEQLRAVLQIVAGLGAEQQEVVALRFIAGLPYAEIAYIMGKSEPAAKMMAYRALEEIRRRYNDVQE